MKIMLDTNVLISAFVFGGKVWDLLKILFDMGYALYVSEYVDAEFKHILDKKWGARAEKIYSRYRSTEFVFCLSTTETFGHLRDAIYHGVNILLTGDKDFLEADVETPQILSPSELLEFFSKKGFFYG